MPIEAHLIAQSISKWHTKHEDPDSNVTISPNTRRASENPEKKLNYIYCRAKIGMIILFLSLVTLILLTEFLFNHLNFLKIHPSAYITQTKYAGINQIENYNYMDVSFNFAVCNYLPPFRENIQSNWLL